MIGDIECAFHVVRDHNARHSQPLLQSADQSIDAVRDDRIETGSRLVVIARTSAGE